MKKFSSSVRLKAQSETLKQYEAQIKRQIMHLIDQKKAQLSIAAAKLEAQSPLKKVGGGYAFLTDENKKPVCSVNQMTPQTTFFAYLSDGIVQADVTKCMPKDKLE
ncbi:MAG: exodeoxyribonuclease VII large subunit [Lachnospiraceae bacterium]